MDFEYDEKKGVVHIIAYKDSDICAKCPKCIRKVCPLLVCISQNFVYPCAESLEMKECLLYSTIQDVKEGRYEELPEDDEDEDDDEPS